jgi:hypothetical protein
MSRAATSSRTCQCETSRERAPAYENALARPESPWDWVAEGLAVTHRKHAK